MTVRTIEFLCSKKQNPLGPASGFGFELLKISQVRRNSPGRSLAQQQQQSTWRLANIVFSLMSEEQDVKPKATSNQVSSCPAFPVRKPRKHCASMFAPA